LRSVRTTWRFPRPRSLTLSCFDSARAKLPVVGQAGHYAGARGRVPPYPLSVWRRNLDAGVREVRTDARECAVPFFTRPWLTRFERQKAGHPVLRRLPRKSRRRNHHFLHRLFRLRAPPGVRLCRHVQRRRPRVHHGPHLHDVHPAARRQRVRLGTSCRSSPTRHAAGRDDGSSFGARGAVAEVAGCAKGVEETVSLSQRVVVSLPLQLWHQSHRTRTRCVQPPMTTRWSPSRESPTARGVGSPLHPLPRSSRCTRVATSPPLRVALTPPQNCSHVSPIPLDSSFHHVDHSRQIARPARLSHG